MLRGFTPRLYQETIFSTAALKNTLVVLPTGMGKTGIAIMLAVQRLKQHPESKILFLAPTKPLAEQHLETFKKTIELPEDKFVLMTGEVAPEKRAEMWKSAQIIFSTPQGLENDLIGGKTELAKASLLVFDEAHKATGNYSYVFIAKQYERKAEWPRILALTASPGNDKEKIEEICKNLCIEAVEIRTENDPEVKQYIQEVEIERINVELPESFKKIQKILKQCAKERNEKLRKQDITKLPETKKELLMMQAQIQARIAKEKDYKLMNAISIIAEMIKILHALELLETQGIMPLNKYLNKLYKQAENTTTKAVKNLTADAQFKSATILAQKLEEQGIEHPKIEALQKLINSELEKNKTAKIIVFTQYRDTATRIKQELNKEKNTAEMFVGQAKKGETGLTQKEQAEMLDMFKDGMFNVLIATSVAEEGLDIPKVDMVVFYEPIPSAIRQIQRRGRTGRQEKGKVTLLVTKGTLDEAYLWSAKHKENRMTQLMEKMRKELTIKLQPEIQQTLETGIKIFADYREKTTGIVKELIELGVNVKLEMLNSADYVLSARVGAEIKTAEDFVNSIIDGRLLEQLKKLKESYEMPIIIIQNHTQLYAIRNVHPNAIRGMLATIAIGYGIPILQTEDAKETAQLLLAMARREQNNEKKEFYPHADKKPATLKEQQEYVITALPNVGPGLARELLKEFGSIKKIVNASEEELRKAEGVGEKTAKGIKEIAEKEYEKK